jgi:hypothetical protein
VITPIEDDQIEADEIAAASTETRAGESALMRSVRDGLLSHCGARASEVHQPALVDRATWLRLHLHRMDQLALHRGQVWSGKGAVQYLKGAVQYLAYSRELTNTLGKLGVNPTAEAPVSLADILAGSSP